jgi:hypothetical protein
LARRRDRSRGDNAHACTWVARALCGPRPRTHAALASEFNTTRSRACRERERERNNASSAVAVDSATPLKSLFGYAAGNDKYIKKFMIDIIRDRN